MRAPFELVPPSLSRPLLGGLTLLVIGLTGWMAMLGQALQTDASPNGIISFELARTAERAAAILSVWNEGRHDVAVMIQRADWVYLFAYPAWFSASAVALARPLGDRMNQAARVVAWAVLLAAPFDIVENHALNEQLAHGADARLAQLAWTMALPKFALVVAAGVFLVVGGGARVIARLRGD